MIPALIVALLACGSPDPELRSKKEALELWKEGKAHLEHEEPKEAEEAFAQALERRPGDPVLQAWRAHAVAEQGDLDGAIALLDALLAEYPTFAEARYNRAAYLARQGDPVAAAADLQRAIEDGARRAREAIEDPDFQPWLAHEAFEFLPQQSLVVAVDAPEGPVFVGSRADVRLRVLGTEAGQVHVEARHAEGPVRLVSVVEDAIDSTEGPGRDLRFTFDVLGPGAVVLGPIEIRTDGHEAEVAPVTFATAAPPGRAAPADVPPIVLTTPSEVGRAHNTPSATWLEQHLLVKTEPGDRVVIEPEPGPPSMRWEMREGGRPKWVLQRWDLPRAPERVQVIRGGETVLDGAPTAKAPGRGGSGAGPAGGEAGAGGGVGAGGEVGADEAAGAPEEAAAPDGASDPAAAGG